MWNFSTQLLEIALRSAIIYIVVLIGLRLTGKREVGQLTPFDLVLLLLISNAVQNAMTGPDTSLTGGLVAAATLLLLNLAVSRFGWKNKSLRHLIEGSPTLLVYNGGVIKANLEREHITPGELHQALREHGVASVSDVYMATLEIDGTISVLVNSERPNAFQPHHRIHLMQRRT
jgi:uncharacterized membrane protein YcaP (DUF421 family)